MVKVVNMRQLEGKPPFKFDMRSIVERAKRLPVTIDGICIHLPFVDVNIKPDNVERQVAREVVIRVADKRVLNAFECCDGCIKQAVDSLQNIRQILVEKQVQLSDETEGALYLLLDSIRDAIRQFLTFEQHLNPRRIQENREVYFACLEMLRGHIHRTLLQIARIADMNIPDIAPAMRYDDNWQLEAYQSPIDSK
jgi:hypothetical protein